jgi:polar amino acid transport system substrate-binding protein
MRVRNDEVDALVADYPTCVYAAMKYESEGLVALTEPMTIEPIGIALPATDPHLINIVQNLVVSMELGGVLTQLDQKWFESGAWLIKVD